MAEILIENQICKTCGADVKAGALFCYYCGASLASDIVADKNDKKETNSNNQSLENITIEKENGAEFDPKKIESKQEIDKTSVAEITEKPITKPILQVEPKMKSAATMRGKSKLVQPKRVEVIWEESENAPNVWFIMVAVFLTIVAAVILFLAVRLK